jgi:hypothetical protein
MEKEGGGDWNEVKEKTTKNKEEKQTMISVPKAYEIYLLASRAKAQQIKSNEPTHGLRSKCLA